MLDEAKQLIANQKDVAGQVGANYGTVNVQFNDRRKKPRSPTPPNRLWTIPYLRNQVFTGRDEVLHELHHRLTATRTAALIQPQAINGLGGVGKTQIAIEYAYRYQEEYRFILWINAASIETLISSFLELAVLLDLPHFEEYDQTKVIAAVKQWLNSHHGWLLIYDNADDIDLTEAFLPPATTGHILLTTRQQAVGTIATSLLVESMNIQDGTLFLLHRAKVLDIEAQIEQAQPEDLKYAEHIVKAMAGLPLAIDQAGAYIEETQCSFTDYLQRYQREEALLLQRRGTTGKAHPEPVATTWSLSFAQVEHQSPLAADLLRFCAFLASDNIPEQLLRDGASQLGSLLQTIKTNPSLLDEAIGILLHFSLVKRKRDTQTISVHRLVQTIQRTSMDKRTQRLWAKRAIYGLNLVFPKVDYVSLQKCQLLLPQVQNCVSLMDQWKFAFSEAAQLFMRTGEYLAEIAQYEQANNYYQRVLTIREKISGPEHPDTATVLHHLAHLYEAQGKYEQADNYHQRELVICEKILGAEHLDTANSLACMGTLYRKWGKYEQAEGYYQRALAIREKVSGPEHPQTAELRDLLTQL